ncbi:MAG: ectoine/hydroxyectoine ABC transporter permease subunit EhuD [Paenibacillus sp.]|uniref:Amino acid ABC transporter membrane protein 2, PAAT family n=1 Tax=Paenibacillus aquistagni TaxID=1852522 RepID=A0A1X7LUF4_9BACL|nr:ectoine/hydroxyectoine ABC transporter permease subunit EhuD [Paenibacillus aquistagni]MBR2567791.1 ectoine/hydroxyectoine ABC transporter permease subunit EhuD [Paenibacillus sp.]NMM54527.1 ectoine/hydroxyectoine ABC transporter permease subunit EhuD [Paenibacillus aquistagni]SMG57526.1 amino acid ABC transporter membrane protein 2, PAAT family [Paenibacillus aquistagni]
MWNWSYAAEILPTLLNALLVTIGATLAGFVLASILGILIALGRRSRFAVLRLGLQGIVNFIRSTPLLVQLFFLYYSLPMILPISLSAFTTGVIGLGLHYATYLSEVYRSGIDAVPKGQWEAATALDLSPVRTWFSIILPQAVPPIIPIMGNYLIVILKETPTLSAITLVELLLTAKNTASVSYRVFEPYTITGILFLVISLLLSFGMARLEKRLNRRHTA